jgi:hypothetical protein
VQKWGNAEDRLRNELSLLAKFAGDLQITDEMVKHFRALRNAELDQLVREGASVENIPRRRVALICLHDRLGAAKLEVHQRITLGSQLVDFLGDGDPLVRKVTRASLTRLADGSDLGAEVRPWSEYFAGLHAKRVVERSEAFLRMAKQLDEAGRTEAAAVRYQQIVREFPGTNAAAEARRVLTGRE